MALFGRTKSEDTSVPADLQQYYNTENPGIGKWLIRGAAFLLILGLLIWSGFWLFNKLSSDKPAKANTPDTSQQTTAQQQAADAKQKADEAAKKAADEAKQKSDAAAKKAEEEKKQAAAKAAPAPAAPAPAPSPTTTPAPAPTPPAAGGSGSGTALPNSGPGAWMAAIFAGASALGAVFHQILVRRKVQE